MLCVVAAAHDSRQLLTALANRQAERQLRAGPAVSGVSREKPEKSMNRLPTQLL
jgi:hypothetical protein